MSESGVAQLLAGSDPPEWWKELVGRYRRGVRRLTTFDPHHPEQNPVFEAVSAVASAYNNRRAPASWSDATRQMQEHGITDEQRAAYKPVLSETIYRSVIPGGYGHDRTAVAGLQNLLHGHMPPPVLPAGVSGFGEPVGNTGRQQANPAREDIWRLYLGLPQQNNTMTVSPYRPSRGRDRAITYLAMNDPINYFTKEFGHTHPQQFIAEILGNIEQERKETGKDHWRLYGEDVMGAHTWSRGQDEHGPYIAYYDRWDLEGAPVEGTRGFVGRPIEIYDRIYYDPRTLQPLPPRRRPQLTRRQ